MTLALLPLLVLASVDFSSPCDGVRAGRLQEGGLYGCPGLPFTVTFEKERELVFAPRVDRAQIRDLTLEMKKVGGWPYHGQETTAQRTKDPVDAAAIFHRPHAWTHGVTPEETLSSVEAEALPIVSATPVQLGERSSGPAESRISFTGVVDGKKIEGVFQARVFRGWVVALIVWGPLGGRFHPSSPEAKAFLGSLRPREPGGPGENVRAWRGVSVHVPGGTWRTENDSIRIGAPHRIFTSAPLGMALVDSISAFEDHCDGTPTVEKALAELREDYEFESTMLTDIPLAEGRGLLVEGPRKQAKGKSYLTSYLVCVRKTSPVRVLLVHAERSKEAVAFVRAVAESAQGPNLVESQLRIAMTGSYWPLHDAGSCTGLETDLGELLADALGKTQVLCVPRRFLGVGPVDGVAEGRAHVGLSAITPTAERAAKVDFTEPYITLQYRLLRASAPEVTELSALADRPIAVVDGPGWPQLQKALGAARVQQVKSMVEALKLLRAGKVDYVAGEDVGLVELMNVSTESLTGPPLAQSPVAMAVPKGQLARYAAALQKVMPEFEKLREYYRPGVLPESVAFHACNPDDERSSGWMVLEPRSLTFSSTKTPPARAAFSKPSPDHHGLCITEPFRPASPAVSRAQKRQLEAALKEQRRQLTRKIRSEGEAVLVFEALDLEPPDWKTWWRVAGTFITLVPYEVTERCEIGAVEEGGWSEPCNEHGWVILAFREGQVAHGHVVLQSYRPAMGPQ